MGQTLAEKIFSHAVGKPVQAGDLVIVQPHPEHGVGQGFDHLSLEFYRIFFWRHC